MNRTGRRARFGVMLVGVTMTALLPTMARGVGCSQPCDDTECTTSVCNPVSGQCVTKNKDDSTPCGDTDQNACTTAGCEAGQCVQTHVTTVCPPDTNECTDDPPCDPTTGQCAHPAKANSTPCGDTDQNLCTTAGCEAGQCVQTHQTTICAPDTNPCTEDPPCNPATGQCSHPPAPDGTLCLDTDSNACTIAGCEFGQCVQNHIDDACEPKTPTATPTVTSTATATATATATPTNTLVPNGGGCTTSGVCRSGNCVDDVCCDTPCQDPLERCDLPDHLGTCTSTAAKAPATSESGLIAAVLLLGGVAALGIGRRRRGTRRH